MSKKNYDEETPGVVGSVLLNAGGNLLIRADFFIDKQKKKIPLKGAVFALYDVRAVNCFASDMVKITKNEVINLTEKTVTTDFSAMLSKEDLELLDKQNQGLIFNGFIEDMNVLGNDVAMRFRVTSRINANGAKLRVDKLVSYTQVCDEKAEDKSLKVSFAHDLFSCPLRKAVSIKYFRSMDEKTQKFKENVCFLKGSSVQNIRNFMKKNC